MRLTLKRLLLPMLAAALGLAASSEAPDAASARGPGGATSRTRKVDEFGRLYGCSGGVRLDNFAIELTNEPDAKGYIVARDAGDGQRRGAARAWGEYFVHYLVEVRGLDTSRFVLVDGASAGGDDLQMELWIVPDGMEPPRVKPPGKKETRPFGGKYAGLSVFNDTVFHDVDGASAGSFNDGVLYAAYAGVLKKQPDSQGYLVVYSPPGAAPGYWLRAGTREQHKVSRDGVAAERMTVINGGALPVKEKPKAAGDEEGDGEETYGRVELWVGAKDSPPVKHVAEDATLTEALMLAGDYFYDEEQKTAAWMLNNLAEMMRADGRSVGCIVVYPGDGTGFPTGEGGATEPTPDVFKIAQGWRDELLKKHGFEAGRVVLLSGPAEDSAMGRLEVWAVPQGAALPDPFAADEEAGEEEGEGQGEDGGGEQPTPPPAEKRSER